MDTAVASRRMQVLAGHLAGDSRAAATTTTTSAWSADDEQRLHPVFYPEELLADDDVDGLLEAVGAAGGGGETRTLTGDNTGPVVEGDLVIFGAGVVGSSMAAVMARAGRRVILIERDLSEPNRIVGELLQPGGFQKLKELGLEKCTEGIDAATVKGYAVFHQSESLCLPYPEVAGARPTGRGFHHGRFVMKLREAARGEPLVTLVHGTVTALIEEGQRVVGVRYKQTGGGVKEARAPLTVICDGCFSAFRKNFIENQPLARSSFVGILVKDVELPYPGYGHVILADPSPVLCYPVSSTDCRLLIDVPNPLPSANNGNLKNYLLTKMAPQLPEAIRQGFLKAIASDRIRSMPNSRLHSDPFICPGTVMVGDSWNMRHPLTGGGMSVALNDVSILAELLRAQKDLTRADAIADAVKEFYRRRTPLAATVNILADALYSVFAGGDDPAMRESCFAYFKLGGIATSGPMTLLAALNAWGWAQPYMLLAHFFSVALYGTYLTLWPLPLPSNMLKAFSLMRNATGIVLPLLKGEHLLPGAWRLPGQPQIRTAKPSADAGVDGGAGASAGAGPAAATPAPRET